MSEYNINYWAVLLYGCLLAVLVIAFLYMLGDRTPIRKAIDGAVTWAGGKVSNINLGSFNFGKLITDNLGVIISSGLGGAMTIGTLLSLRAKKKENEALLEQYQQIDLKKAEFESIAADKIKEVNKYKETITMYEQDKTPELLNTQLKEMREGYERQIQALVAERDKLQRDLDNRPVINVTETRYK